MHARPNKLKKAKDRSVKPDFDRQLNLLTSAIQQFRVDSQRFLAGDLKIPPDEQKTQIERMLRSLRGSNLKSAADNFRLNSLEAQYSSHCDLFGRRLRKIESGEQARAARKEKERLDPEKGVVVDSKLETVAVNALYQGLYLQGGQRNPKIDLERFRSMIGQQAAVIRKKTGCEKISFRVAAEDGKLKLKAKPIRS